MFVTLNKKILFGILLISTVITTLVTLVSFYLDYDDEVSLQNKMLRQLEALSVPSLTKALWDLDDRGIETQVAALSAIRDIVEIEVLDTDGKVMKSFNRESESLSYDFSKDFPIIFKEDSVEEKRQIGTLRLKVTKKYIYERIYKKLYLFFVMQFLKTLILSTLIFILIYKLITNRITHMYTYLVNNSNKDIETWKPFSSHVELQNPDEISLLEKAFNTLTKKIVDLHQKNLSLILSQGKEIDAQRQNLIESARLAAVGEMSSGIAHEINTPLSIISMSTTMLDKSIKDGEPAPVLSQYTQKIHTTVKRITKIISSMKLSTRDSSHDPMAPVELKRLIEESFALSELRIKSLGIQITISESCKTNDLILCREGQIVQVMINLINNSLDAIQPQTSPWIKVDTKISKPGFIDILIVDSGHGIPDHVRHKIFEPFYTTKEVGKGTGLGLSISRKYILDNQGDFFVDTENPNTCFVIRLPLV